MIATGRRLERGAARPTGKAPSCLARTRNETTADTAYRREVAPRQPPTRPRLGRRRAGAAASTAASPCGAGWSRWLPSRCSRGIVLGSSSASGRRRPTAAQAAPRSGYSRADRRRSPATGRGRSRWPSRRAENAAINRTLAYTPYVRIAGSQHREIALTFDDGPGPYTPQVLSVLEREHVPATFFEVGVAGAATSTPRPRRSWPRGYPIGDHTQTHAPMSQLSRSDQQRQLLQQTAAIGDYGAPFPRLFRPPVRALERRHPVAAAAATGC